MDSETKLEQANQILASHTLAAVRLLRWDECDNRACFEVFHCEWPSQVFGELEFLEVSYLQCQVQSQWGYQMRIVSEANLPSRGDVDPVDKIYELFATGKSWGSKPGTPDPGTPSAFIVAQRLVCRSSKSPEKAAQDADGVRD